MKVDYYELLGVTQTATESEIKKAYRKNALRLHPDKNPDHIEEATKLFNEVRIAYETLSDAQERAWYDSHKFQILMEDEDHPDDAYEDDTPVYYAGTTTHDIQKYMNADLYSRLDDSIQGFYKVVSVLLCKISSEEVSTGKQQNLPGFKDFKDDTTFSNVCDPKELMFPVFGNSKSDYGTEVRIFYKIWSNFQSVKTFAWLDEYRYSSAPDRRTRRLMEKENKKARDQGRREYNEAVRKLISYIKKRDPRVNPAILKKYEQERLKKQQAELKEQAHKEKKERQRQRQLYEEQDWQSVDPDELAEIEEQLNKIYEEEKILNGGQSDEEPDNGDYYECIICDKTFKSEKQFQEHEKSKKHSKLLKKLQWEMRREGIELGIDGDGYVNEEIDDSDFDEFDDAVQDLDDLDLEDLTEDQIDELLAQSETHDSLEKSTVSPDDHENSNNESPAKELLHNVSLINEEPVIDDNIGSDDDIPLSVKKSKNNTDEKLAELTAILDKSKLDLYNDDDDWSNDSKKNKSKKKGKKGKSVNNESQKNSSNGSTSKVSDNTDGKLMEKCTVCGESFQTRNKLFQHISSTGHALAPRASKKSKKKNKRK